MELVNELADKVIFLDRDGVINEKLEGDYVKTIDELKIFPEAFKAIKLLKNNGYVTVLITNQRGIARGLMTPEDLATVHDYLQSELARHDTSIDAIFYCPHDYNQCKCRKPEIGLFLEAEKIFSIDKSASYMIGDSASDIEAGRRYGVRTVSIKNALARADFDCENILEAAHYIISVVDGN